MSDALVAKIPEGITYVFRASREVAIGWDDIEETGTTARVDPAFPVETGNAKTLETAQRWAVGWSDKATAPSTEIPNEPIAKITIVNLELRDEGGRAYKVALPSIGGRTPYVDLREDVLLDAMLTNGVGVGGVLEGPFVWARVGSHLKLIRVGSVLHRHVVEADARGRLKIIAGGDLQRGGVYSNKKGEYFVYLGQCDTDELEYDEKHEYGHRFGGTPPLASAVSHKAHRNVQAWFELKSYAFKKSIPHAQQFQDVFEEALSERSPSYGPSYWCFEIVKKKSASERVGTVNLPENLWERIHDLGAAAAVHRAESNSSARNYATQHWDEYRKQYAAEHPGVCAAYSKLRLVRNVDAPRPEVLDYERWLPTETLPKASKTADLATRFVPGGLYESKSGKRYFCFGACVTNEITTTWTPGAGGGERIYESTCSEAKHTVVWLELSSVVDETPGMTVQRMLTEPGYSTAAHRVKFGMRDYTFKEVVATFDGTQWEALRATAARAAAWSKRNAKNRVGNLFLPRGDVDPEFLASISRVAYVRAYGTERPEMPEFDRLLSAPVVQ